MKAPASRVFQCWNTVFPAEDLPGQWVAHCLDLDVVTQGDSVEHALKMLSEAASMVLSDDIRCGRDPMDRRAPRKYWDQMWKMMRSPACGKVEDLKTALSRNPHGLIAQVVFRVNVSDGKQKRARLKKTETPLAMASSALHLT